MSVRVAQLRTWQLPWESHSPSQGVPVWTIVGQVIGGVHLAVPSREALPALVSGRDSLERYV